MDTAARHPQRASPLRYLTVSVPFIPMAKWPGNVHTNR